MVWTKNTDKWLRDQGFSVSRLRQCTYGHPEPIWTNPDYPGCAIVECCCGQLERAYVDAEHPLVQNSLRDWTV